MQYRHEVKHEINTPDMIVLRSRLRAVMRPDPHARGGKYQIRSLYFDDLADTALRQKLDGLGVHEKFRLRMYNGDPSVIHLERKYKRGALGTKESASLTPDQTRALIAGDTEWMAESGDETHRRFAALMKAGNLRAKTIVDYTREPFVYAPGNVRVALDYGIRTGMRCTDFLNPDCVTVPIEGSPCILEVKWDRFLPDVIRGVVQLEGRHGGAFSKYAAARMYE